MRFRFSSIPPRVLSGLAATVFLFGLAGEAHAQFIMKWLAVGRFHKYYTETSAEHHEDAFGHNVNWPGIRDHSGNVRGYAFWVGAKDFTDETGKTWTYKVAHVGPRITGVGEFFPQEMKMISKFEPPVTTVDGFETFLRPVFNDEVDPSLPADRAIVSRTNTVLGVEVERRALAWSNEFHQDYHIVEYTFTNTGNVDADEDIELQGQDLKGVYFWFQNRYATNRSAGWQQNNAQGWGKWQMNDAVGDGHEDYGVDFSAQYSWLGHVPIATKPYQTTVGGPLWEGNGWLVQNADTLGRLGANNFIGKVYLHADDQAYPTNVGLEQRKNDVIAEGGTQPRSWRKMWTGHELTHINSHMDEGANTKEYTYMSGEDLLSDPANKGGNEREYPHHADLVLASNGLKATPEDFAKHTGDPTLGQGSDGFAFAEGFGPYDIPFGQSVKLVIAEAVGGLSERAEFEIGRAYKIQGKGNDSFVIPYDANGDGTISEDERLTKNQWVMTSKDSLFMIFSRAKANYESGYRIPHGPKPPKQLDVRSGVGEISLSWEPYPDASNRGWQVWRAQGRFDGLAMYGGQAGDFSYDTNQYVYRCVAGCDTPLQATSYSDTNVQRGLNYFYHVVAVGDANADPTGNTPVGAVMKSNRYYAQTYQPATLKREPGSSLEAARIVPNPYNRQTASSVRWSHGDQLGFLDIPGNSTIRIFTELGELVKTIRHTDGSGDQFWDMMTESQQLVVSGVYIAAITDEDTGETVYKKFVIIR